MIWRNKYEGDGNSDGPEKHVPVESRHDVFLAELEEQFGLITSRIATDPLKTYADFVA